MILNIRYINNRLFFSISYYVGLKRRYVPDIKFYRDKLRDFYYDFEKCAPGPLFKTT
ncbi:CDP-glycerol glycerophosphotransferase family protein [Bacillus sp. FSL M8-0025]|uniref:CDP-glycerol glycerophosphotransferase family protein n=1 Tax=Bacillus sp. FSL M8-0025 TaxID=2921564 RepID=UPI0030D23523